jgi:hypothetical protein
MGWHSDYNWKSKKDVVASSLQPGRFNGLNVIAHKSTRSGLWMVVENPDTGLRGIAFDLIERRDGTYWVKEMAESDGPYYYDCPEKFLTMVPPIASKAFMYNNQWRSRYWEIKGVPF